MTDAAIEARPAGAEHPEEVRMTFGEHLEELRWRLMKSVVMVTACFVVAMVFYKENLYFITRPHFWAMQLLNVPVKDSLLLNLGYTAPIWATMKLSFIIALFVASPWVGYQIWAFVAAGLYPHEKKWVRVFSPISFLLFTGGCAFGYLILVPYGLYGMATMMRIEEVTSSQYALGDYLGLVMTLTIVTGAIFQLPMIMCFTTLVGLTTAKTWWKWTRAAIVIVFIAAAILTPSPDIYTQLLMAAPLLVLYFVGMGLCVLIRPRQRGAAARA